MIQFPFASSTFLLTLNFFSNLTLVIEDNYLASFHYFLCQLYKLFFAFLV